ncbi:GNAT family N-acetyltransferase [Allorhizocola rhizosphaerae]|uniref:GNAT family N-acetyltransferase n=1 Tax=Allorhizocola rhizosphaerae TaxID=1872709 RepID=UPI001FE77C0A|nr:GNAT family N-acetyltransferase [Allorhizocola rhizosphaerae]
MSRAADVLLADGMTVHLRPIEPSDADAVVAMHSRFSERTRYMRYFSPYPRIPARDLHRFVNVDHRDREALVVAAGDDLIAVGRYERLGEAAADAEVAFVVADAYQRRGVGSVLLEHLAAAAREAGIERFVAEVLPANSAMLKVFADAGYEVSRRYADGVVHLTFPVAQTERSLAVQWEREHRTEARSVARLMRPSRIAVYGASRTGRGVGAALLAHLRASGFPGPIDVMAPGESPAGGVASRSEGSRGHALGSGDHALDSGADAAGSGDHALDSGADAADSGGEAAGRGGEAGGAGAADLAVVAVPPGSVPEVVADAAAAGVHGLLVITDLDPARRHELVQQARQAGMRVIGPASLGLANNTVPLNVTLVPHLPRGTGLTGRVALFCQSGPLGLQLLAEADRRGLGMSSFVSVGRRADVSGNDLLQFWADDPDTDVIAMYLETFGNPRKFSRIARAVGRRKPIIVLAGAGDASLGGAVAGADRRDSSLAYETGLQESTLDTSAMEALRARSGVIEVDTVAELFDVAELLDSQPLPTGDRVGIVSNAFSLAALASARARKAGLRVGRVGSVGAGATPAELAEAVRSTLHSDDADALVIVVAPPLPTGPMAEVDFTPFADALAGAVAGGDKPVVATYLFGDGPAGVPTYRSVEEAIRALTHAIRRAAWLREPAGQLPAPVHPPEEGAIDELLRAYGVPTKESRRARSAEQAVAAAEELGLPVALKAIDHPHRIDLGAVRLNLGSAELVRDAYADLRGLFGHEVVVQGMAPPGVACVVEALDDPAFGPVVGFGLGGPVGELVGDRAWRAAPLTDRDAASLVRAPKAARLLDGMDLDALAELLVRIGQFADEVPRLKRLTLNPVLVHADGWTVLDATGQLDEPGAAARPDTGPRRMRSATPGLHM